MSERRYSRHVGADLSLHFTPEGKQCTYCNEQPSQQEEPVANNIDEQQITLLDNMRSARDAAYRYAQSKHDRATLMRIQADALEAEGNEIVSEINEGVPTPESE